MLVVPSWLPAFEYRPMARGMAVARATTRIVAIGRSKPGRKRRASHWEAATAQRAMAKAADCSGEETTAEEASSCSASALLSLAVSAFGSALSRPSHAHAGK